MFALLLLLSGCTHLWAPDPLKTTTDGAFRNVVVVYIDTLRADRLGFMGYNGPTSPELDALAEQSTVFEHAIAPSPWTYSSSASMMTGLYPPAHKAGVPEPYRDKRGWGKKLVRLSPRFQSLAEVLSAEGFETAFIARNTYLGFGVEQGFQHYDNKRHRPGWKQVNLALEWLDEHGDERFFLTVHLMDMHNPLKPHHSRVEALPELSSLNEEELKYHSDYRSKMTHINAAREYGYEEHVSRYRALYDAALTGVDFQVMRLIREVREHPDTLVIFTADHGEALWEHAQLEGSKWTSAKKRYGVGHGQSYFDEVVHVPLLMFGPGRLPATRVPGPVSGVDVFPTVLDLLDVDYDGPLDGKSLVGQWDAPDLDRIVLSDSVCFGRDKTAVISEDLTYTVDPLDTRLLVSRADGQNTDLSVSRMDDARRLQATLETVVAQSQATGNAIRQGDALEEHQFSSEEVEALKALGYIED